MRYIITLLLVGLVIGCAPPTPEQRLINANKALADAKTPEERFYALSDAAKENFTADNIQESEAYAKELVEMAPKYEKNWNYGNAVQNGNEVLGRIAIREERIDDAKRYLLESAKSTGSPQMNSFGPNMILAKDLLELGHKDVVLEYFDLCRKFWKNGQGKLDQWTKDVEAGKIPNFGANLYY